MDIKILDFALSGTNYIGSELHHFANRGLQSQIDKDFFEDLAFQYSQKLDVPVASLKMAAYVYASKRSFNRISRGRNRVGAGRVDYTRPLTLFRRALAEGKIVNQEGYGPLGLSRSGRGRIKR